MTLLSFLSFSSSFFFFLFLFLSLLLSYFILILPSAAAASRIAHECNVQHSTVLTTTTIQSNLPRPPYHNWEFPKYYNIPQLLQFIFIFREINEFYRSLKHFYFIFFRINLNYHRHRTQPLLLIIFKIIDSSSLPFSFFFFSFIPSYPSTFPYFFLFFLFTHL